MASIEHLANDSNKTVLESQLPSSNPPPPRPPPPPFNLFMVDLSLRLTLFAFTMAAIVDMSTSKQTELLLPYMVTKSAKVNSSPAWIYFVAALCVACLYSIFTIMASIFSILKKPSPASTTKLLLLLVILDSLMTGLVASATGASTAVAYIGLWGNSHIGWMRVCYVFDDFCWHIGSSNLLALVASIVLLLLVFLSIFSLYLRIR